MLALATASTNKNPKVIAVTMAFERIVHLVVQVSVRPSGKQRNSDRTMNAGFV